MALRRKIRSVVAISVIMVVVPWHCDPARAGEHTAIGDRIQFSNPGSSGDLPSTRPKDDLFSKPFEFLDHGSSFSGAVAPAAPPAAGSMSSLPRDSQAMELFRQKLDQKRNWIYVQPDDLEQQSKSEDKFDLRGQGGGNRKPATALENYLDRNAAKASRLRTGDISDDLKKRDGEGVFGSSFESPDRDPDDAGSSLGAPFKVAQPLTAGFSLPDNFFNASAVQKPANDASARGLQGLLANPRGQNGASDEFRKLLITPGTVNPLASGFDLMNLNTATARQPLSPVVGASPGDLTGSTSLGALNPLGAAGESVGGGSTLLDSQSTKILGPTSLSPAVRVPTESVLFPSRSAGSDVPVRKF